jgi:hypothetical protein
MRLLLGHGIEAHLLVDANCKEVTDEFKFRVINGEWNGAFDNGTIIGRDVWGYENPTVTDVQILCSDQELLSGEYNDVIDHYNNRISANELKTYDEFASIYTKNRTTVYVDSLDTFFDLYPSNTTSMKDLISFLTDLETEHSSVELFVNQGCGEDVLINFIKEESDEEFNARIRKSYNGYVARQNLMSKCIKVIKKAETREDKINALEAEIERLKQLEN